jgi:methane/ammonia monooxygenase subunit B
MTLSLGFDTGGMMKRLPMKFAEFSVIVLLLMIAMISGASAHGERNQEPFLRMRTTQWYDVKWSTTKIAVNEQVVVTGKVRIFDDWPNNLPEPKTAFLANGTPGPVLVRIESYLNGIPMIQSTSLEKGRDYEFKTILVGRVPGKHHVHPMFNVQGAGPILGPGSFLEVTGNAADFRLPVTTLDGIKIDNLETWGVDTVVSWHLIWIVLGVGWLLWWLRRPTFIPRYAAIQAGMEEGLVTPTDRKIGLVLLIGTVLIVYGGYQWAEAKYPKTVPLQAGKAVVEPLPIDDKLIKVKHVKGTYDVPGRSMKLSLDITNTLDQPVQIGEFTTANLRFVAKDVPPAVAAVDAAYPKELIANAGLVVSDNRPLQPGEHRRVLVEATDAAWEAERLTSLINDPDNRYGALLFFYEAGGARHIASVSGPIVPTFKH